jgi:DHA2 family multidrug resistance protein
VNASAAPEQEPLQGVALLIAALAINLGVFAEVLDLSIINVAVPAIAGGLGASQTEATWAITSYAVAAAIVQPITGWLTQRYGEVRIFMLSSLLFTLLSVMCGLAPNIELLVLFRLLQGAAGGPLVPLSQSLMMQTFPPHQKSLALGLWGMTALAGPVFGPILGGWLTDSYSWRWVFFINAPVGVFTVTAIWALLRYRDSPTTRLPVDYVGMILLALGVGSLQFMFDHGHEKDWFDSPMIVSLAVMAAVAAMLFVVWERYEPHPIVSFRLFRRLTFAVPVLAIAVGYGAIFGIIVIFPLWLEFTLGYTATLAGLASLSFGVAAIISAMFLGVFGSRLPARTSTTAAFLLYAIGAAWLALLPADATFWQVSIPRILHGIASPLFYFSMCDIMYTGVPPSMLAAATSLSTFVRTMFVSLATAMSVTLWDQRSTIHHVLLAETVNPANAMNFGRLARQAQGGLLGDLHQNQVLSLLDQMVQAQARTFAFDDLCWVATAMFLMMIPLVWLPKPPFSGGGGGMH